MRSCASAPVDAFAGRLARPGSAHAAGVARAPGTVTGVATWSRARRAPFTPD